MRLIIDQNEAVGAWASYQLGITFCEPFQAFGVINGKGEITGAVIFNNYDGMNIDVSAVGNGWTRQIMKYLANYAFKTNNCLRVSAKTKRSNVVTRKLLPRMGFVFEGTAKMYFGTGKNDAALCFALFRDSSLRYSGRNKIFDEVLKHG